MMDFAEVHVEREARSVGHFDWEKAKKYTALADERWVQFAMVNGSWLRGERNK